MREETVKAIITDYADPSVGIFQRSWTVECPFNSYDDVDKDELEFFREEIAKVYKEFADGRLTVEFDFELKAQYEAYEQYEERNETPPINFDEIN